MWWVLRGSNSRPTPCKGAALPTELSTHVDRLYCCSCYFLIHLFTFFEAFFALLGQAHKYKKNGPLDQAAQSARHFTGAAALWGYLLMASFRALPGRNFGTLAALILMDAPVWGLRPMRAARLPTANVPNPTRVTDPPLRRVVRTPPITASNARPAAAFDTSASLAMCSIISFLFTKSSSLLTPT